MRLTVFEYDGQAVSPPLSVLFSAPGATIGRGADNHLVLPDDTRQISRLQAAIYVSEAGVQLKNLSTVCPIGINEKMLLQQEDHPLLVGDTIRIGAYLLRAEAADSPPAQRATTLPLPLADASRPHSDMALHQATAKVAPPMCPPTADSVPVSPLMAEAPASHAQAPDPLDALLQSEAVSQLPASGFMDLFDDTTPAAEIDSMPAAPAPPHTVSIVASPADQGREVAEHPTQPRIYAAPAEAPSETFWENLVAEFAQPATPAALTPADEIQAPLAYEQTEVADATDQDALVALRDIPADPLALFDSHLCDSSNVLFNDSSSSLTDPLTPPLDVGLSEFVVAPQADRVAELRGHFQVPHASSRQEDPLGMNSPPEPSSSMAGELPVAGASPVSSTPLPQANTATVSSARPSPTDPAWFDGAAKDMPAAFQKGAGLELDHMLDAEQLHTAGRLLASMLGGTMALLSSRTIIKREVKADLTMILDRENNPLKLLPDANTVLKQMFGPPFPGFMSPEHAIDDAFHDLQAHQIGMLAGMRAALRQLLHKVSPSLVEQQLGAASWHERLVPRGRDSRAWVHYCSLHQTMVTAVEEDFHTVFGQAFLAAYDAEVELYRQQCRRSA
ncbi:type VI secretion system-associated FHA domain protein TagH [Azotobacter armeniacus]